MATVQRRTATAPYGEPPSHATLLSGTRAAPIAAQAQPNGAGISVLEPHGVVLTAQGLALARPALPNLLCAAGYSVQVAPAWDHLLDAVERSLACAVVVDLDAVERERQERLFTMSGPRLIALLARAIPTRHFGLVVQTRLDFAEIEDLVRLGTQALVSPDLPDDLLIHRIHVAARRAAAAQMRTGT